MKSRIFVWTFTLLAVLATSSCVPAVGNLPDASTQTLAPTSILPSNTSTPQATLTLVPTVQAVATSRGPKLEATDPTTVNLASGQLQLVEFFRFT